MEESTQAQRAREARDWLESRPVRCTVHPCGNNPPPDPDAYQVLRGENAAFVAAAARCAGWHELSRGYQFLCPDHAFMTPHFEQAYERGCGSERIDDPKEAAIALIDWYVLRGDSLDDLATSRMGRSGDGYAASITQHKVVVDRCAGREGPWSFSLAALYREIMEAATVGQQLRLF